MNKKIFYSLFAITMIMTFLTFSSLDKIANWLYNIDPMKDYYSNWNVTISFRRTWGIINLGLLIALTIYSWVLFILNIGINRKLLAAIGVVGLLLLTASAFFAAMYSNRIV
jgi:uncharacterized protein YacL